MKYGEALRLVFEAFYSDRSDENKQYVHTDLKQAIEKVPLKWRRSIWLDVGDISRELRASALRCKHEKLKDDYSSLQVCADCGATRMKVATGRTMFGAEIEKWEDWWL